MGRLMDAMQSERDHEYALNISANVVRGRRAIVDLGYWATVCPYGFDRAYREGGQVKMTIPRRDVFTKPRNWHLVPTPNPDEAKVVKMLFDHWRERDASFTGTVRMLYERGIPSPSGRPSWTIHQVKDVLSNRVYCGDAVIGEGERTQEVHNRIGVRVKEGAIPAIIDRRTWETVNRKVRQREGGEWRPKTAATPLSGILRCGHCGYVLAKRTIRGRTKYVCESALRRPHLGCSQWRLDEGEVLPIVCREVADAVDFELLSRLASQSTTETRRRGT